MKTLLLLPLAFAIGAAYAATPDQQPGSVTIQLGKGQAPSDVTVTRRKTKTSKKVAITLNPDWSMKILEYVEMHGGRNVDISKVPADRFAAGSSEERVRPTTEKPSPSTVGAFRTVCIEDGKVGILSWDDPIVYPGEPGRAHPHVFCGNTGGDANSTYASLLSSGNSTSRGGTFNRSLYWVPALVDDRTSQPVLMTTMLVYYKAGDDFKQEDSADGFTPGVEFIQLPPGLKMIAGNPGADGPPAAGAPFEQRWKCDDGKGTAASVTGYGSSIPNCAAGSKLYQEVFFAQCWDGKNLDSPDHKSHLSYPVLVPNAGDPRHWSHRECPATHRGGALPGQRTKVLPKVSYEVAYDVTEKDAPLHWRLASDMYDPAKPGGYSSHGDWFGAWKEQPFVEGCIKAKLDCHAHLLGDGREQF